VKQVTCVIFLHFVAAFVVVVTHLWLAAIRNVIQCLNFARNQSFNVFGIIATDNAREDYEIRAMDSIIMILFMWQIQVYIYIYIRVLAFGLCHTCLGRVRACGGGVLTLFKKQSRSIRCWLEVRTMWQETIHKCLCSYLVIRYMREMVT
jgi:hypothetical protein